MHVLFQSYIVSMPLETQIQSNVSREYFFLGISLIFPNEIILGWWRARTIGGAVKENGNDQQILIIKTKIIQTWLWVKSKCYSFSSCVGCGGGSVLKGKRDIGTWKQQFFVLRLVGHTQIAPHCTALLWMTENFTVFVFQSRQWWHTRP